MHYLFIFASEVYNQDMESVALTESEVAYIVDILTPYSLFDQKILDICHILMWKFKTEEENKNDEKTT